MLSLRFRLPDGCLHDGCVLRVPEDGESDEIARLAQHFNELLDALATQNRARLAAQKDVAEEASRRRALFEKDQDGIVVLDTEFQSTHP